MYTYYDIIEIQSMGKPTPHSYILSNNKVKKKSAVPLPKWKLQEQSRFHNDIHLKKGKNTMEFPNEQKRDSVNV